MTDAAEDLARVQAVTVALAGPQKVWVFHLYGDAGPDISLHATKQGAIDTAMDDMRCYYNKPLTPDELVEYERDLEQDGFAEVRSAYYQITEQEIKP